MSTKKLLAALVLSLTAVTNSFAMDLISKGPSTSINPKYQKAGLLQTVEGKPLRFSVDGFYHTFTPNNSGDKEIKLRVPISRSLDLVPFQQWSGREILTDDPNFKLWEFHEMEGSDMVTYAYYLVGERDGHFYAYITTEHLYPYGFENSRHLRTRVENGNLVIELYHREKPYEGASHAQDLMIVDQTLVASWDDTAQWFSLSAI